MQLHLGSHLASILAALLAGVDSPRAEAGAPSASEFEKILTRLSTSLTDPKNGPFATPLQRLPDGQTLTLSARESSEVRADLNALLDSVEAALGRLEAEEAVAGARESAGGIDPVWEVKNGGKRPVDLNALLDSVEAALGRLGAEEAVAGARESASGIDPVWEVKNGGKPLADFKALRVRLEEVLQSRSALPAEENSALAWFLAVSQWIAPANSNQEIDGGPPRGQPEVAALGAAPAGRKLQAQRAEALDALGAVEGASLAERAPSLQAGSAASIAEPIRPEPAIPVDPGRQAMHLASRSKDAEALGAIDSTLPQQADLKAEPAGGHLPDIQPSAGIFSQPPTPAEPDLAPGQRPEWLPLAPAGAAGTAPAVLSADHKPVLALPLPLGHPEWADELGQRLIWMHGKAVQAAELHLNPPQLGPVAVRIQMHDDQASVQFASPHAAVREAIEAALPRLKELFHAQQVSLAHVEVGQQAFEDRSHARREPSYAAYHQAFTQEGGLAEAETETPRLKVEVGNRLLSLYA
ncbi:hypothetical protein JCM13664_05750 [Methylothermus subterraneus]